MKITFNVISIGKEDKEIFLDNLEAALLDNIPCDSCLYDDCVLELDANYSSWDDVPASVQDAIYVAINEVAEDFGIEVEIIPLPRSKNETIISLCPGENL